MKIAVVIATLLALSLLACAQSNKLDLTNVNDIPLTGGATRLDYQSFDPVSGRLYIAHLGDDMLTVFDAPMQKIVGDVKNIKRVHGVIAVPELHKIYASATGTNELVVIDEPSLQITERIPAGDYPDGIAFAGKEKKIYVSDKAGKTVTVIDAVTNRPITAIPVGGPVGNSQYDAASDRIFVAVHKLNEIVEIDPQTDKIAARHALTGCKDSHGLLIDSDDGLVFAACEGNSQLVALDLAEKKQIAIFSVGEGPDVLAFDKILGRLYVASESGVVSIFEIDRKSNDKTKSLKEIASEFFAANAHTVAVNNSSHLLYFPLENINGKPILRIVSPGMMSNK
jgi:YVTN family beta-propeller protein